MTIQPTNLSTTQALQTAPPAGAPAQGAPAGEAGGPDPQALIEAKIGLDQREEAYQGIVGTGGDNKGGAGASLDKPISELTDEELHKLFGGDADKIKDLGAKQPGLTAGQIQPLRKDPQTFDNIAKLLTQRSDLNIDDIVSKGPDGKIRIDPSVNDEASRDLMLQREDLKPGQLSKLSQQFNQQLKNPGLAQSAYKKSIELMKTRTDIKPDQLGTLMNTLVNGQDGKGGAANPAAAVDMFDSATKLLNTRRDLGADDANRLAGGIVGLGGKKDPNAGMHQANAFAEATDLLSNRPAIGVGQVIDLAGTMKQRFPGEDEAAGADRAAGFSKGISLMKNVPGMTADKIDGMLQKAQEGPPPRQGIRLLNAFDTMSHGLQSGRANQETLTDPLAKPDPTGQKRREGEIALDKYGNEKAADAGQVVPEHKTAHGSQVEFPKDDRGPAGQDQTPGGQGQTDGPGAPGTAEPGGQGGEAATPGQDPQDPRRQP